MSEASEGEVGKKSFDLGRELPQLSCFIKRQDIESISDTTESQSYGSKFTLDHLPG